MIIRFNCVCGRELDPDTDARIDGPDSEVVVFTADAYGGCSGCGRKFPEIVESSNADTEESDR